MYKNIFLAFFTFFICLSLVELYCRWDGRYASYSEKTGASSFTSPFDPGRNHSWYHVLQAGQEIDHKQSEFTVAWTANNEGFKGPDFRVKKNKKRIIVMGDSYTEGVGAANDSSFPAQLGYLLRDSFPSPVEVWNCGIAGSDPVYEYRLFKDRLLKYDPDMVLVAINVSDIHDVTYRGGFERFQPDSSVHYLSGPWFMPLYAHSYLTRRVVHDVYKYNWEYIRPGEENKVRDRSLHILTDAMDSFTSLCAARHIKLLFVFHPGKGEFNQSVDYEVLPLISFSREKRLPIVDIREGMYALGCKPHQFADLYWVIDGHCKNKGYHYYAASLYDKVSDMLNN